MLSFPPPWRSPAMSSVYVSFVSRITDKALDGFFMEWDRTDQLLRLIWNSMLVFLAAVGPSIPGTRCHSGYYQWRCLIISSAANYTMDKYDVAELMWLWSRWWGNTYTRWNSGIARSIDLVVHCAVKFCPAYHSCTWTCLSSDGSY